MSPQPSPAPAALTEDAPTLSPQVRTPVMYATVTGGLLLGITALTFKINDGTHQAVDTALSGMTGFLFITAGAISHFRRPANPVGLLIGLVGIAFFTEDLKLSDTPLVFTIGLVFTSASSAVITHLVVAFPHGALRCRGERLLVAAAYIAVFGCGIGQMLFSGPRSRTPGQVRNLLVLHDDPTITGLCTGLLQVVGTVVAIGVVVVLVCRWIAGELPQRHLLTPVVLVALVGGVASALNTTLASEHLWGFDHPLAPLLTGTCRVLFCLWPLVFLTGVLRADADSAELTRLLVERNGEALAELVRNDEVWQDSRSFETLTAAAGLVCDNERLTTELANQLVEVQASRTRLISAADAERRRLERDLHDGAQQRLVAIVLSLRIAQRRLGNEVDPGVHAVFTETVTELRAAIGELRALAAGIRPAVLTEAGPVHAVRALLKRFPLPVHFRADAIPRLDAAIEATAYFVISEGLTNTAKHAHAGHARVDLRVNGGRLHVEVTDDGAGGADLDRGTGLKSLRDRVRALGGDLTVRDAPRSGTTLRAVIPLER